PTIKVSSIFESRTQSTDRRLSRGHQEPVVPARVASIDGPRGETTNAIRLQPLAAKRSVQVTTHLWPDAEQTPLQRCRPRTIATTFGVQRVLGVMRGARRRKLPPAITAQVVMQIQEFQQTLDGNPKITVPPLRRTP